MFIPDPTEESFTRLYDVIAEFNEGRGEERYRNFSEYLLFSSEAEKWLLALLCYLNSSRMFTSISRDPYLMFEPAVEQASSLTDFLKVLKAVHSKSYDKELIQFMLGCTEKVQEFYWLCLEQPRFLNNIAKLEVVRDVIADIDITTEELMGDFTFISSGWSHITFPLVLTAVPDPTLNTAVIYRVAHTSWFRIVKYEPRRFKKPKAVHVRYTWLTDRKFIHTSEFVIMGKIDEVNNKFYPFDFFQTVADYRTWRRGKGGKPHKDRVEDLNYFLKTNFVRQIQRVPLVYAHTSHNMEAKISQLLREASSNSKVMACDGKLRTYCLDTVERDGVIGGIWQEVGEVKGFIVWHQAQKVHVGYDFPGNDEALIFHPKVAIGKLCKFTYFEYDGYRVGGLKEILWDVKPYKGRWIEFTDGERGYIERCPFCMLQEHHYSYGCCRGTIKNFTGMFVVHGPDTWFDVTPKIKRRRALYGWTPEFLNRCDVRWKQYRVVANEEGQVMFQSDERYALDYQHWWNTVGIKYPYEDAINVTREDLAVRFQAYVLKQMERKRKLREQEMREAGSLCEVPELHQQDIVADAG